MLFRSCQGGGRAVISAVANFIITTEALRLREKNCLKLGMPANCNRQEGFNALIVCIFDVIYFGQTDSADFKL